MASNGQQWRRQRATDAGKQSLQNARGHRVDVWRMLEEDVLFLKARGDDVTASEREPTA